MSITLIQEAGSATNVVAFTNPNVAGNFLVAIVRNGVVTLDTTGNDWVLAVQANNTLIYYAANCVAGANTVTCNGDAIVVAEFSGLSTGAPLDQGAGDLGSSTDYSSGPITPTQTIELIIGGVSNEVANGLTNTPGVGWADVGVNGDGNVFMNYQIVNSRSPVTNDGTLSSSVAWHAAVASFGTLGGNALTLLQGTSSNPGTSTNPTLAFSKNTTGGSFLLAMMGTESSAPTFTGVPTDTLGNTWIQIGTNQSVSGVAGAGAVWYAINKAGGGANTVTFHMTGGGQQLALVAEFSGQALVNPLDQFAFSQVVSTDASQNLTPITFSKTNETVISLLMTAASFILTPGTGYVSTTGLNGGAGVGLEFGFFASGPQTPTASIAAAGNTMMSLTLSVLTIPSVTPGVSGGINPTVFTTETFGARTISPRTSIIGTGQRTGISR